MSLKAGSGGCVRCRVRPGVRVAAQEPGGLVRSKRAKIPALMEPPSGTSKVETRLLRDPWPSRKPVIVTRYSTSSTYTRSFSWTFGSWTTSFGCAPWFGVSSSPRSLLFRDVARSEAGAATLYAVTDDQPARSTRWREFIAPQGYGDELRAAFRLGGTTWGVVDLMRDRSRAPFTPAEVELVRAIAPAVGAALRALATREAAMKLQSPRGRRPRDRAVRRRGHVALPRRAGGTAVRRALRPRHPRSRCPGCPR
ncbi:hypothetical protein Franean1_0591 [Parafrankia sp. EAN1pec]|nr:hypothetical protein Franean1_0591 [Frankia sp. EAN1pec]